MYFLFTILQVTLHQTTLSSSQLSILQTTTAIIIKLLKGEIGIVKTCPDVVKLCIQMIYLIAELCRYGKLIPQSPIHIIKSLAFRKITHRFDLHILFTGRSSLHSHLSSLLSTPCLRTPAFSHDGNCNLSSIHRTPHNQSLPLSLQWRSSFHSIAPAM